MRSVEDLRRTLENHTGGPQEAAGVLEGAQARAGRIRRRRRVAGSAAAAVAVAVAALGVPLAVRQSERSAPAAVVTPAPFHREASQLTIDLVAGSRFLVVQRRAEPGRQSALVRDAAQTRAERPEDVPGNPGFDLVVHDPGAFDATPLRRGQEVTVAGRTGWYVQEMPDDYGDRRPAVGWEQDGGVWVIAYGDKPGVPARDALIDAAGDVRLQPPSEARTPVQFGWVPGGLPVTHVDLRDEPTLEPSAEIGFGDGAAPAPRGARTDLPLLVLALPVANRDWTTTIRSQLAEPRRVGGHDTWYLPQPNGLFGGPATGSTTIVDAGACNVTITVRDRMRITEADVMRLVERATFGDCADVAGWKPPVT